ncbi:protein EMSY-LIKE 3-like [Impatiens glandulifera]|uniref:protein EMSY-LIKE 3-like n=1 Tax=Impatiens glandulifera TaxID=253017 RepID=UPI001FB07900|nr:protein EMSY-LIKE 3-like [Impatiens glandulifera]
MDYGPYDSSGTDDDLSLPHQNRVQRGGRVAANGRPTVMSAAPYGRMYDDTDMETQIHLLEQEAYSSVLRAFRAQADAITWEKESLITELRKELRLSNEEHRELMNRVNSDDLIRRIREWRQSGGHQPAMIGTGQAVRDPIPSPSVSASRKKQKMVSSVPSQSYGAPTPPFLPQPVGGGGSSQPSSSTAKRGPMMGGVNKGKKSKSSQIMSGRTQQHPSSGPPVRGQQSNRVAAGAFPSEPAQAPSFDSLMGRKVRTRWPDDNNFYEAVITDFEADKGRHALVYDMGTEKETWEWVNISEISPEDIQWVGEDPGISRHVGSGHGMGRPVEREGGGPALGRGRGGGGVPRNHAKKELPSQNGIGKKGTDEIQILHTDSLVKEVERVFSNSHPNPIEVEKAKKALKDQEQALTEAIAKLADISDGESDEGGHFLHGKPMEKDK